jgi:hypothetical protein
VIPYQAYQIPTIGRRRQSDSQLYPCTRSLFDHALIIQGDNPSASLDFVFLDLFPLESATLHKVRAAWERWISLQLSVLKAALNVPNVIGSDLVDKGFSVGLDLGVLLPRQYVPQNAERRERQVQPTSFPGVLTCEAT